MSYSTVFHDSELPPAEQQFAAGDGRGVVKGNGLIDPYI
jgi:hypothetical protein